MKAARTDLETQKAIYENYVLPLTKSALNAWDREGRWRIARK